MDKKFIVSVAPHVLHKDTTQSIMRDVLIALLPTVVAATVLFGMSALVLMAVCVAACIGFEWIFQAMCKRKNTISDLSAAVTGLLLAMNLPSNLPIWQAIVGCVFAIIVVKQIFGGLGQNFANPAITARVIMLIAFSGTMTSWPVTSLNAAFSSADVVTAATPLSGYMETLPSYFDMFIGNRGGSLGETCIVTLLIGGIYLIVKRVITWHAPVAYLGTVALIAIVAGDDALMHLMGGGIVLGAFFMATDYVTTPPTSKGRIVFGIGCGLITMVIRLWGAYPEGCSFAILLMNILTPHITKWTAPKPFGGAKA